MGETWLDKPNLAGMHSGTLSDRSRSTRLLRDIPPPADPHHSNFDSLLSFLSSLLLFLEGRQIGRQDIRTILILFLR